jgi:hypothetical protein
MFFRDEIGDRFLVKSRYRYITPKIELNYNDLVEAIYDAIDKEVAHSGGEATNDVNPYTEKNFDELMEDAKELWIQLNNLGKTGTATEILEKEFGRPIKFSEILPEQVEQLSKVIFEIRSIM